MASWVSILSNIIGWLDSRKHIYNKNIKIKISELFLWTSWNVYSLKLQLHQEIFEELDDSWEISAPEIKRNCNCQEIWGFESWDSTSHRGELKSYTNILVVTWLFIFAGIETGTCKISKLVIYKIYYTMVSPKLTSKAVHYTSLLTSSQIPRHSSWKS